MCLQDIIETRISLSGAGCRNLPGVLELAPFSSGRPSGRILEGLSHSGREEHWDRQPCLAPHPAYLPDGHAMFPQEPQRSGFRELQDNSPLMWQVLAGGTQRGQGSSVNLLQTLPWVPRPVSV